MKNPLLVPEFREMLEDNDIKDIIDFCLSTPPSTVADFLGALSAKENKLILTNLESKTRSMIFSYFDDDVKLSLISLFENNDMVELIARMLNEEQIHFLKILPVSKKREIMNLSRLSKDEEIIELAEVIDQLLKPEEPQKDTMTAEEIAEEIKPLIDVYKISENKVIRTDRIQHDCWVNISAPSRDDLPLLARYFKIPIDFLTASLDIDETARIETEDNATLIIIKAPYFDESSPDILYFTLPIGIIKVNGLFITVCSKKDILLKDFIENKVKRITAVASDKFLLQILYRATMIYLQYLKQINNAANMIQKILEQESKNKQLIKLLNIEKSLVYFTTSLKTNALMFERLQRLKLINMTEETSDLFDDIIIENKQAQEMANIYSDILSGTMDAFASIISNNLNIVMKILTSITLIMMIPNLLTGFYGMNVKLPFQQNWYASLMIFTSSVILIIILILFFIKKRLF